MRICKYCCHLQRSATTTILQEEPIKRNTVSSSLPTLIHVEYKLVRAAQKMSVVVLESHDPSPIETFQSYRWPVQWHNKSTTAVCRQSQNCLPSTHPFTRFVVAIGDTFTVFSNEVACCLVGFPIFLLMCRTISHIAGTVITSAKFIANNTQQRTHIPAIVRAVATRAQL